MKRHEVQAFVRRHRKISDSFLERRLWDIAEAAPLGGGLPGGSEDNPYLLRIYVSPRDPQFQWLWKALRLCANVGAYDPKVFQGFPHLYLHHFFRGDDDVEVHNHPWQFSMSLILTGGYVEERWNPRTKTVETEHFNPGCINVLRRDDFHRVTLNDAKAGCWTLFMSTNRVEEKNGYDWGFLHPKTEVYTPWGPWLEQRAGQRPKEEAST